METQTNAPGGNPGPNIPNPNLGPIEKFSQWVKSSILLKLIAIGILVLILMIPTSMVSSLIRERQSLKNEAVYEVSSNWGLEQKISGPVISVPFHEYEKQSDGTVKKYKRWAHFLPEAIAIDGKIVPQKKYRGIYVVVLYNAKLAVNGKFNYPDFSSLGINPADVIYSESIVSIGLSDLKGLKETIKFKVNDTEYTFNPGVPVKDIFDTGLSFPIALDSLTAQYDFSYNIDINGSTAINFEPFGKDNSVQLESECGSPSFQGDFLPDPSFTEVSDNLFKSRWKVLNLNRNYAQSGIGSYINEADRNDFGVKLMLPVDEYNKIERSVKYCLMFIVITFIAFFFVEIINKRKIHPIQYLLVGIALCVFYVLLLSISEHLAFNIAYLIGSLLTVSLLTYYVYFIFKNVKLTISFSVILSALYFFYFSLLQLENYSLLLGSAGLFAILAIVLYLTRKIDWYNWNK